MALSMLAAACSSPTEPEDSAGTTGTTAGSIPPGSTEPDSDAGSDADDGAADADDDPDAESSDDGDDGALSADAVQAMLSELGGQLAIGNGPIVAVARPDGQRYIELDGGSTNLTSQPTWSSDGAQLIWSSVSAVAQEARVQGFDDEGVASGEPLKTNVPGPPIFYFQWRDSADDIVYLRNSVRRQTVESGVLNPGGAARWLADGDPFFLAWAPTTPVIAAHVGDARVAIFDPAGAAEFGLPADPDEPGERPDLGLDDPVPGEDVNRGGGFSAPAWLDDSRLLVVTANALSAIDVEAGTVEPLLDVAGPVRFVLSPDRSRVAFQLAGDLPDDEVLEVGVREAQGEDVDRSLVVFDLEDRSIDVVTDRPAVAWEWSPDSAKLAWLEFDGPVSRRRGRWRFWSADGPVIGDTRSPTTILSVKEMVSYLPFFSQYSFSHRRWSPDSSAFALVGSIGGRSGVWIQLVDVPADPVRVAPGDLVNWGFGPTPSPDAGRSPA